MFHTRIATAAELEDLFCRMVKEGGPRNRLANRDMTASEYFRHIDGAHDHVYIGVYPDDCDGETFPVGFARLVFRSSLPGTHALPGDNGVCEIDEVYVLPGVRGRSAFPCLLHAVKDYSLQRKAFYVYARCTQRSLQRVFMSYGLQPWPVFAAEWRQTTLPEICPPPNED